MDPKGVQHGAQYRETCTIESGPILESSLGQKKIIAVEVKLCDGKTGVINALIDTGAKITLLRTGLVPPRYFAPSAHPKNFITASQASMAGGLEDMTGTLILKGTSVDTGREIKLATLYDQKNPENQQTL